jgi:hypothetical protein
MRYRSFVPAIILVALAACSGDKPDAKPDAELTRDLQLANQPPIPAQFELRDTALSAPAASKAKPQTKTPIRRPTAPSHQQTVIRPLPRPTAPEKTEVAAAPAPAPAPRFKGFDVGTSFGLTTKSQVCTTNLPGDKLVATTSEPVRGENGALIPAGTSVVLEVASVTPGDKPEDAQIVLRVRSIDLNEEPIRAEGDVAIASPLARREVPRDKNADRRKVVTGAVAGAVLGQIMGKNTKSTVIGAAAGAAAGTAAAMASRKFDACLPAGANLRVTTTQQIAVSE